MKSVFGNAIRQSSGSPVSQKSVIAKVYFPHLIIPICSVLSAPAGLCR
ncbi:MAG: hypothetical protein Q8O07_05675 [Chloroflexota bacterium]|nr:hypothetical protein [Chloroflexota bacterium]